MLKCNDTKEPRVRIEYVEKFNTTKEPRVRIEYVEM